MSFGLLQRIVELENRIAEMERRGRNRERKGEVTAVDHKRGVARVKLTDGEGGKPFLTPEIPWSEIAAGEIRSHIAPSVGQQVVVRSENGDLTDATIDMSIPSNAHPRPHDGPEAVITKGSTRVTLGDDGAIIKSPTVTLDGDAVVTGSLKVDGASVTHGGVDIGKTHRHTEVMSGPAVTGPPQS